VAWIRRNRHLSHRAAENDIAAFDLAQIGAMGARPHANHRQDAVRQRLGHSHLWTARCHWDMFAELTGEFNAPCAGTVEKHSAFVCGARGLHSKAAIGPAEALDRCVIDDFSAIPCRSVGKGRADQSWICRTVIRRKGGRDCIRTETGKAAADIRRRQFLKLQSVRARSLRETLHVTASVFIEDQAQMPGGAKLDVASEQRFCLVPQGQSPPRERQLRQMPATSTNIAERRYSGAGADIPTLDQCYAQTALRQEKSRGCSHQATANDDHVHMPSFTYPDSRHRYQNPVPRLRQSREAQYAISKSYGRHPMRARQLEVFTAVMRSGTVTGAAQQLNISQPALSQTLLHTEDELGFKLFDRKKGRLYPTPEALELYPEAERLFAGLEGLRRKTSDLRLGRAGLVRIAASPPPGMTILPRALAIYRKEHPEIILRTHVAPVLSMVEMLRSGDAGLALALDDRLPPDIAVERISETGFCCLLPENHPLTKAEAIRFADIAGETVISYRGRTRPYDELAVAARACGVPFAPHVEIDSSLSAAGFVHAGLGVAVVDALLPWAFFPGVVLRPLAETASLPVSLLTLRGKSLSRAEEAMSALIRETSRDYL